MQELRRIAADPVAAARSAKERTGRQVVGSISSWIPDELILAAGAQPLRFPAGFAGVSGTRARTHMQAASCFYCRDVLEAALTGTLDLLDGIFFVQTCDTQQNLSDIWKVAVPDVPVVDMYMPVNRSSRSARDYLVGELKAAAEALGSVTGTQPDETRLEEALETRGRLRKALADLYDARLDTQARVPAEDVYAAGVAASCLPADDAVPLVEGLTDAVRSGEALPGAGEPLASCVITGSVIPYPGLYALLDDLEVSVRDDDLSLGRRLFDHPVPHEGDPWVRLARSMIERSAGATKHDEDMRRGETLLRLARRADVDRVILPVLKFCDPWAWDYPALKERMELSGIRFLLIELAGDEDLTRGPVRNRVEAWFEMGTMEDLY